MGSFNLLADRMKLSFEEDWEYYDLSGMHRSGYPPYADNAQPESASKWSKGADAWNALGPGMSDTVKILDNVNTNDEVRNRTADRIAHEERLQWKKTRVAVNYRTVYIYFMVAILVVNILRTLWVFYVLRKKGNEVDKSAIPSEEQSGVNLKSYYW